MTRDDYIDVFFEEMDLGPRWRLRETRGAVSAATEAADAAVRTAKNLERSLAGETLAKPPAGFSESSGNLQKRTPNATFPPAAAPVMSAPARVLPPRDKSPIAMPAATGRDTKGVVIPVGDVQDLDWDPLENAMRACRACGLCRQRRQAVCGVGDRRAEWLFVGEGPGVDEDSQGEPFVGQSGKLLDNMLLSIGLKRGENVYIANAVKCRPPNNRTPEASEIAACRPYIERQVALLQPKLIVLLGRAAAHSVLNSDESLASLRGRLHQYRNIPVVVTYHPAYLLRTLTDKAKAWEDLCLARRSMQNTK